MGLRTRLAGARSVVRHPPTQSFAIAAPLAGPSVDAESNEKSSSSKSLDSQRRSRSGSRNVTDSPVSRTSRRSVDLLNLRTRSSPSPAPGPEKSRRSVDLFRLPFSTGLRSRKAARAASNVSADSDGAGPSLSTKSIDASVPPAEPWHGSGSRTGSGTGKGSNTLPPRAPSLLGNGSRVSNPEKSQAANATHFRVPPFTRRRIVGVPEVPVREQRRGAGAFLSDGSIVFQVPDRWSAARTEDGFRLVAGACVGYLRATSAREAAVALCDTRRLAVLDAFEVSASPVVDSSGEAVVLVVEYRNYGAGRGLALLEPDPAGGAVVFGLSGPPASAGFLGETEQQLLGTARVISVPGSSIPSKSDPSSERPSSNMGPSVSENCTVM